MKPIVLSTLTLVPVALGLNPAGRWGHQAVYVPSQAAMYVVGGQVSTTNFQITNDVLVFPVGPQPERKKYADLYSSTPPHLHSLWEQMMAFRHTHSPAWP